METVDIVHAGYYIEIADNQNHTTDRTHHDNQIIVNIDRTENELDVARTMKNNSSSKIFKQVEREIAN